MIEVTPHILLNDDELVLSAMTAQGAGGQNVNKVASAIHLRFDIRSSSLPEELKARLLTCRDHRITADGVVVIKAQRYRQQEKNRADAVQRLVELIRRELKPPKPRKATRPTKASREKRLDQKSRRGQIKSQRRKIDL